MKRLRDVVVLAGLILVASGTPAAAFTWSFEILAEEFVTLAPGTATAFTYLDVPVLDDGRVVFRGGHPSLVGGIWQWEDGTLETVLSGDDIGVRGLPDLDGSVVSFTANEIVFTKSGAGGLVEVADTFDAVPGGAGTFDNFRWVATDGTIAVFSANGPLNGDPSGIYATPVAGGTIVKIADTSDGFTFFRGFVGASAGELLFLADDAQQDTGLYRARTDGTGPTTIVDNTTVVPVPGSPLLFHELSLDAEAPSIDAGRVLFYGFSVGLGVTGLFLKDGDGPITAVVTNSTVPPGSTDSFADFADPSLSGNAIAFRASGFAGGDVLPGLYAMVDDTLDLVAFDGQVINGRPMTSLHLLPGSLDGTTLAFHTFLDDTNAAAVVLATCLDCPCVVDCLLFEDGFETGDTSRWSASVP